MEPRLCYCDNLPPYGVPYSPAYCRLCWLYWNDPGYRALWSEGCCRTAPARLYLTPVVIEGPGYVEGDGITIELSLSVESYLLLWVSGDGTWRLECSKGEDEGHRYEWVLTLPEGWSAFLPGPVSPAIPGSCDTEGYLIHAEFGPFTLERPTRPTSSVILHLTD